MTKTIHISNKKEMLKQGFVLSRLNNFMRKLVHGKLDSLSKGSIQIIEGDLKKTFGNTEVLLKATVSVYSPQFYYLLITRGSIGALESFMDGHWHCDDLVALSRILIRDYSAANRLEKGFAWLSKPLLWLYTHLNPNTKKGSVRNIQAHYDLSNDFFKLFLDKTLTYSCAFFSTPEISLEEAQIEKLDRLCRKLNLTAEDSLLEIGTGWGSMAIHAAQKYGCSVTTTTISKEQFDFASARVREAGLQDKITILQKDYRDLTGTFDKLVSIEMIEAVGPQFMSKFVKKCSSLINADGLIAIQGITISDQNFKQYIRGTDFLRSYIFPGGSLISIAQINEHFKNLTNMRFVHLEDITNHYALTLREWRERFNKKLDSIYSLGFSTSFCRLWEFYLASCEAAFLERHIGDVQMIFASPETNSTIRY
ncbi:MAG: SAM-dependent methyltransferase [Candidatus Marinimicrobia bacterium]|nr:SAM-dependent methyltransferase [Candidatus Neomarinimicrobiota bacterium]|tara:strand:- start:36130 stop:37398 length:1269 start_codon:yes stop_codon:yes gene_type:complete